MRQKGPGDLADQYYGHAGSGLSLCLGPIPQPQMNREEQTQASLAAAAGGNSGGNGPCRGPDLGHPATPVTGTFAVVSVTPPTPRHTTQAVSKTGRGGHDDIDEQVLAGPASPSAAR